MRTYLFGFTNELVGVEYPDYLSRLQPFRRTSPSTVSAFVTMLIQLNPVLLQEGVDAVVLVVSVPFSRHAVAD